MPTRAAIDQILDSLVEEVVILDPQGVIVQVNEPWRDFARRGGVAVIEVSEGVNYLDVLRDAAAGDANLACVHESLQAVLDGSLELFEYVYPCPNRDEMRWFSQRATPLKEPRTGALISHIDITSRKVAEQERDAHRLELSRAVSAVTLGQLSGSIAHELNQPLTAILANCHAGKLMASKLELPEGIVEILSDLEKDARRARNIIERLRSLLQNRPFRSEIVDVNDVVQEALAICRPELVAREIEVRTELQSNLPPVQGDSIALQHVLLNLIVNAYEAMSESPTNSRRLELGTHIVDGADVAVTVADSGPGIPREDRDRLFKPLFTTKKSGLGLGLSICRSVIEKLNGEIDFSEAPVSGAKVIVRLPADEGIA